MNLTEYKWYDTIHFSYAFLTLYTKGTTCKMLKKRSVPSWTFISSATSIVPASAPEKKKKQFQDKVVKQFAIISLTHTY